MAEVEIPKQCKAGVVVNEGPDFKVEVQMVDVPEPGEHYKGPTSNMHPIDADCRSK